MQAAKYIFALFVLSFSSSFVNAHHSYSIYDIDNKIERTGVLTQYLYISPHVRMELTVEPEDGDVEVWDIVSRAPRLWERAGHEIDFAEVGDTITILGWPARDGSDHMALSTIITGEKTMVILEEVTQQGARDNLPEVTIKRE